MSKKLNQSRKVYKEKLVELLQNKVSNEIIESIKNTPSKNQINSILLTFTISTQEYLAKNGISCVKYILPKKFAIPKSKQDKGIFVKTESSVKPIYTPMGNKR